MLVKSSFSLAVLVDNSLMVRRSRSGDRTSRDRDVLISVVSELVACWSPCCKKPQRRTQSQPKVAHRKEQERGHTYCFFKPSRLRSTSTYSSVNAFCFLLRSPNSRKMASFLALASSILGTSASFCSLREGRKTGGAIASQFPQPRCAAGKGRT